MIDWPNISYKDLAGFITEELRKNGIHAILVGGACATIYSKNKYQSYDLDYVTYEDMKKVKKVLKQLNFIEKDRYFQKENCKWFIEFVSPPVAIGDEAIHDFNHIKTQFGTIILLHPIDSVKDRLASFYHWDDKQGLESVFKLLMI